MTHPFLAAVVLLVLPSCATSPLPIAQGQLAPLSLQQAQASESVGARVRWGGMIVSVMPLKSETCFEVLSRPLDGNGEPEPTDQTQGRFIACGTGLHDPAAFPAGREITFVGSVHSVARCKIGEFDQHCPRIAFESHHLWPKRVLNYYEPLFDFRPIRPRYWRH